jgi:hypothetical protein
MLDPVDIAQVGADADDHGKSSPAQEWEPAEG